MKRLLPDLRNARAGIEPKRTPRADGAKPTGLRVVNVATDPTTTEIWIYDEIDPWWGVSAQEIADALATVTTPNVRVRINSPGGDVFEGIAIMNLLASYNGLVTGVVDGLCASIATVIAMACETITMSPGSQMMIHPASGICFGDEADMLQMAALLGFQTTNIAGLYAARAGGTPAHWLGLMQAETWMTADEAVTAGLADATGVVKQSGVAAVPDEPSWDDMWDLSVYKFAGRAKAPAPAMTRNEREQATDLIIAANLAAAGAGRPCACGPNATALNATYQHKTECTATRRVHAEFEKHIRIDDHGQWHVIPRTPSNVEPSTGALSITWNWNTGDTDPCDECQFLADSSPYADGDQPEDPPLHPHCDCVLESVLEFVDKTSTPITAMTDPFMAHFTSPPNLVGDNAAALVEAAFRKAFV